jgi:hypothetical protein
MSWSGSAAARVQLELLGSDVLMFCVTVQLPFLLLLYCCCCCPAAARLTCLR